ncbi:MAG: glycosyl transferase family 2 [Flavobacteriales bacterium]|nr:glycosyl transferase family 2 [Flavobacteriales bacterium]|tara:strand:+ start:13219 stop:13968 length:750 start_codon:yes stop_codon:yes gene_type:complete
MLGIVIQARTGSNRLPNKMLLPFYASKGVLELLLEKLRNTFNNVPIIVATTTNTRDDVIVKLCLKNKINYFRGSEHNVLHRFIDVANKFNLTKIIRVCADNPFLSMEALSVLISKFPNSDLDYMSFQTSNGVPVITTQYGFWAEAVTLIALKRIKKQTNSLKFLEHVTNYIYDHPESFNIKFLEIQSFFEQKPNIRMTLDTHEDYLLLQEIYKEYIVLQERTLRSLVELVSNNRIWLEKMNLQMIKNKK